MNKLLKRAIGLITVLCLFTSVFAINSIFANETKAPYVYTPKVKTIKAKIGEKLTLQPKAKDKAGNVIDIGNDSYEVVWAEETKGYGGPVDYKEGKDKSFTIKVSEKWLYNNQALKTKIVYIVVDITNGGYTEIARGTYHVKGINLKKSIKAPKKVKKLEIKQSGKTSAEVSWKRLKKEDYSYKIQIQYATNSKFNNAKKELVDWGFTSAKLGKLKKGSTYYIRARRYKMFDKKKYYGKWSDKKAIKIS